MRRRISTRRDLLLRLVEGGPDTATRLARSYSMTRQAIVKHLQALADAGLVEGERHGREVRYRAEPGPLTEAVAFLLQAGSAWDRRLDRLAGRAASARPGTRR